MYTYKHIDIDIDMHIHREPPVGGDMISENQALASFDFLDTTGDSDSDEEEEEEEEEEGEEGEDPTVSADDEFTSGFIENPEPVAAGMHLRVCILWYIVVTQCVPVPLQSRESVRRAGSSTRRSRGIGRAGLVAAALPSPSSGPVAR